MRKYHNLTNGKHYEGEQYFDWKRRSAELPEGVYICPWVDIGDSPTVHGKNGQDILVDDGDWIMKDEEGNFTVVQDRVFKVLYMPVRNPAIALRIVTFFVAVLAVAIDCMSFDGHRDVAIGFALFAFFLAVFVVSEAGVRGRT